MKRILITGINSYIGNSVERYLMEYNAAQGREHYRVDKISLRDDSWERYAFGSYDAVLHVAGLAHADVGKVSEETKALYYAVNTDLTEKVAEKAKEEGVPQFIYLSSVIVYGDSAKVGEKKHITADTQPQPANFYGDSKLQAELRLRALEQAKQVNGQKTELLSQDQKMAEKMANEYTLEASPEKTENEKEKSFRVAILRPPMIYGRNSKGNFPMLVKLAEKLPFFPKIINERSMLYVENLAEFIRLLVESGRGGLFFPQNPEYVTTSQMVRTIGEVKGKKIRLWSILNPLVKLAAAMPGKIGGMANKAFGSLTIDRALSDNEFAGYQIYSLQESVKKSI